MSQRSKDSRCPINPAEDAVKQPSPFGRCLSLRLLHVPVSFGAGTFSLVPILIVEVKQLYA